MKAAQGATHQKLFESLVHENVAEKSGDERFWRWVERAPVSKIYDLTLEGLMANPTATDEFCAWMRENRLTCERIIAGCLGLLG